MTFEFVLQWFAVMFPLIISPGPGNVMLAAAGMKQGTLRSIPLILGINLGVLLYSLLIGLGMQSLFERFPFLLLVIKLGGIAYLLWLAIKFWKPAISGSAASVSKIGFKEGLFLQLLNPKGMVMLLVMFSLFASNPEGHSPAQVYIITGMLLLVNITSNFIWVMLGGLLNRFFNTTQNSGFINRFFAVMLVLVAVWLFIDIF